MIEKDCVILVRLKPDNSFTVTNGLHGYTRYRGTGWQGDHEAVARLVKVALEDVAEADRVGA